MSKLTYYTAFVFEQGIKGVENLHCTHKYLGELDEDEVEKVIKIVELFFKWARIQAMELPDFDFNLLSFFDEGCVVLEAENFQPWPSLREELDAFRKDDRQRYRAHVTVAKGTMKPEAPIEMPIRLTPIFYRLLVGNTVMKGWGIPTPPPRVVLAEKKDE